MIKVRAHIEMPMYSKHKYEVCKETGLLVVDRELDIRVPYNYGFIPSTLAEDGDALDLFVVTNSPVLANSFMDVEVIGGLDCIDNGYRDVKLIARPIYGGHAPGFNYLQEIRDYLSSYKAGFKVLGDLSLEQCQSEIYAARRKYMRSPGT